MFDTKKFSEILKKCQSNTSLNEFARLADVDAGYLSRIINMKKVNPPTPKVLRKIADASKGITTYEELMRICGYLKLERTPLEDEAIKGLENMIERQVPGYSLIDITLKYINKLEGKE